MQRREFLTSIKRTALGLVAPTVFTSEPTESQVGSTGITKTGSEDFSRQNRTKHKFRISMYIPELALPFDESLAKAKEIGVDYVWFNRLLDEPDLAQMSNGEVDRMARRVERHNLKIFLLNAGNPFKRIHLTDFDLKTMTEHEVFRRDFDNLVRSMQIAARIGVGTVGVFTFAWPGEYSSGKPTWPMRWVTRGGIIADVDMDKLVKVFSLVVEQAERYDVDVALSMMPWNYTNTTTNFRRLAERVGSRRIKVMWGPADNWNCGELDVSTAGFNNVRPYLYGLHLKDLNVINGLRLKFKYRPIGDGDVDYLKILQNLRDHSSNVFLSLSTHFRSPSGSREEAMRINHRNLKDLIRQVELGA